MTEHAQLDPDTGGLLVSDRAWRAVRALGSYFVPRPDDELDRFLVEALTVLGR